MMNKAVFLMVLSLLVSTGSALAHGIHVETSLEGGVIVVSSQYAPTQPLADASVSVYSPADPENAWQTGRTDQAGHFAFVPDVEGEWTIVIDDRQGHMKRTVVNFAPGIPVESEMTGNSEITGNSEMTVERGMTEENGFAEELVSEPEAPVEYRLSSLHKVIVGLSLIIGITGLFYGMKARQERKSE